MITTNNVERLLDHTEHYRGINTQDRVAKIQPSADGTYNIHLALNGAYAKDVYNKSQRDTLIILNAWLSGAEAIEGEVFTQWINQANRECVVVALSPTRVRIEYDMPNTGINGAWRKQVKLGGLTFVDCAWDNLTGALK